jgi:hypothetical protein
MHRVRRFAVGTFTVVAVLATAATATYAVARLDVTTDAALRGRNLPSPVSAPATRTPAPRPATHAPTPTLEPRPEPEPLLAPGDQGRQVRELQSRLHQLDWFGPVTTGAYDRGTRAAVRGFQEKRGFQGTGEVDPRTWRRLVAMTESPTEAELFNRPGPTLFGAGVTGALDQRTLDLLEAMTSEPTADELANRKPDPAEGSALDPRCTTGRALCIDKSTSSLRWVVDGRVLSSVDVRFGASYSPTREGLFHVQWKSRDHVSSLYGSAMPVAMFFSGGQAVHYSSDFAARGYAGASHGCVNVRDYDAIASLFDQVNVGDKVVIYWS